MVGALDKCDPLKFNDCLPEILNRIPPLKFSRVLSRFYRRKSFHKFRFVHALSLIIRYEKIVPNRNQFYHTKI
jgi:hypothetical protein